MQNTVIDLRIFS